MNAEPKETKKETGKKNFFKTHLFDFLLLGALVIGTASAYGVQIAKSFEDKNQDLVATVLYEGKLLPMEDRFGNARNPLQLSSIAEYEEIEIKGRHTTLIIGVKHNAIAIVSSGCPGQECVKTGWVKESNHPIICAHNGIYIDIQGGQDDSIIM